jgi:predicted N-acetyltransferase YhbS
MNIIIRAMKDEESLDVRRLGRKTFMGFESLFMPTPKKALVALQGDKIVGAVLYKFLNLGKKKVGYIDFAFVDASMHGFGVGNRLYHETTQLLWDEGCDYISALVKDDFPST